jgi:TolB-like protein
MGQHIGRPVGEAASFLGEANDFPYRRVPKNRAWIYVVMIGAAFSIGLFFVGRYTARNSSGALSNELPVKSIAVLPFGNLSRDPDNAYFAEGIQDEIVTRLSKIADLKVISRTSVMQYRNAAAHNLRDIAKQLGVGHILEGTVQRIGDTMRVSAQLIDARTDTHEWAENFDRPVADVFAIQTGIAKAIADQLRAQISPREKAAIAEPPTTDLLANQLYIQAKELIALGSVDPGGNQKLLEAVRLLNQAVGRDPRFLNAYCLLQSVLPSFIAVIS